MASSFSAVQEQILRQLEKRSFFLPSNRVEERALMILVRRGWVIVQISAAGEEFLLSLSPFQLERMRKAAAAEGETEELDVVDTDPIP